MRRYTPFVVCVFAVACRSVQPPLPPPAKFTALYDPADVKVYVSPEAKFDFYDIDCDRYPEFSSGEALSITIAGVLAHAGFHVVHTPHKDAVTVTAITSLYCVYGLGNGTMALHISHNDQLIDRVEVDSNDIAVGRNFRTLYAFEFAEAVSRELLQSNAVAELVRSHAVKDPKALALLKPASLLILPIKPGGMVAKETADSLTGYLLSRMDSVKRLRTVGKDDIEAALGLDKQRQALGCDLISCMTELGGALGVDIIMYGDLTPVGTSYAFNLSIVRASDGQVVARTGALTDQNDDDVVDELDRMVAELVEKLNSRTAS